MISESMFLFLLDRIREYNISAIDLSIGKQCLIANLIILCIVIGFRYTA
jgi:hypothetical protein